MADTPELRAAYNENQPKVTEFWTALGQNERAVRQVQGAARATRDFGDLTPARKKIVDNALRDFRLGGAELPGDAKARFAEIQEQLADAVARASPNTCSTRPTTTRCSSTTKPSWPACPTTCKAATRAPPRSATASDGYKFTLHFPSYFPVMQYADNRALRERIYRAYVTTASERVRLRAGAWDNTRS